MKNLQQISTTISLPQLVEKSIISAIPKFDKSRSDPENYYPISLLNSFSKILKNSYIIFYFTESIMNAFRKKLSTTHHHFCICSTVIVSLDPSKTFYQV